MSPKTFRFDDISVNTDEPKLREMLRALVRDYPSCALLLGVSPFVHDMSNLEGKKQERTFPEILNAYSDHRVFYKVQRAGVPAFLNRQSGFRREFPRLRLAGHGLVHVDHRLLSRETQELSILTSCSLLGASVFVPPFNKYNADTQAICREHAIDLIKFEDGWRHMVYYQVCDDDDRYYLHTHDFTLEEFLARLPARIPARIGA